MPQEMANVTKRQIFLVLWADSAKCLLRPQREVNSVVSERLDFYLRKAFASSKVLDEDGTIARISGTKLLGVDWSVNKESGPIGAILGSIMELATLSPLVRIRLSLEPVGKLSTIEARAFLIEIIRRNDSAYTHAPSSEIISRLKRAKTISEMSAEFYGD